MEIELGMFNDSMYLISTDHLGYRKVCGHFARRPLKNPKGMNTILLLMKPNPKRDLSDVVRKQSVKVSNGFSQNIIRKSEPKIAFYWSAVPHIRLIWFRATYICTEKFICH